MRVTVRLDFDSQRHLGHGKIRLLELIEAHGSISSAARAMGMSYRRAWLLVDSLNQAFREPVVATQHGGQGGGGAQLTQAGQALIERYRTMEGTLEAAAAEHLTAFASALSARTPVFPVDDIDEDA